MPRRLPALSALLAFEAVARHLSFTAAARELCVTPGAVSQQVRQLEERLGYLLFYRSHRTVRLTSAAVAILPHVREGIDALDRVVGGGPSRTGRELLTISTAPSFASKWLLPRLPDFAVRFPEVDLRLSATAALVDFRKDEVDLAIRFGPGKYEGLKTERLFRESLSPMCSPAIAGGRRRLRSPEDLRGFPLIHDVSLPSGAGGGDWARWLHRAGVEGIDCTRGMRFSLAELALQAAIDGSGVVLGRVALARRDIMEGRLLHPFDIELPLPSSYHLVMPKGNWARPDVQSFRTWLLEIVESENKREPKMARANR